ncbi:MAG: peptide ABC transporter substrate-binding protein [Janthinobacterium lividum]
MRNVKSRKYGCVVAWLAAGLMSGVLTTPTVALAAKVPAGVTLAPTQALILNNGAEVDTLDPNLSESFSAHAILANLFEGLTANDNHGATVPGVAEKWEQKDSTTWVFHLRKNAKWSNGETVTASDFVYSMQRLVDPKTASSYAGTYGVFIANGADIIAGKKPAASLGVRAIDATTLEIRTPYPVPFLPDVMVNANLAPLNRAVIEKYGADWTKPGNLVGNGAFMLKSWQVNDRVVIVKNPQYWDAANVQLTRITFLPIESEDADIKMFQSGSEDWEEQLPPGAYPRLKQAYPQDIRNVPMLGLRYYTFNMQDPVLKDVRVRQALSMVVDRDVLAQHVTASGEVPSYGLIVRGLKGADISNYDWAGWPMARRVAAARQLLAAAGVKPGTQLHIAMNTSDYHRRVSIFLASEWKSKLGLDAQIDAMEFKVLLRQRHAGQFQVARNGWVADYNDASTFLTLVRCGSDQNDSRGCDPKADALMLQASRSNDPALRQKLQTQAAQLAMANYPILPLLQYTAARLVRSYVGGYTNDNPLDRFRGKDLYIIKH